MRESYRRVRAAIARINSFTQEHISGMPVVQLFNREKRAFDDFEVVNRQHMIAFKDTIFAYALYYPAVDFLSVMAVALVIWRGGWSVLGHGAVTIGMLAAFNMYSQRFWRPIQDLERQVQHPAGGHGGLRADFQADGYAGRDCVAGSSRGWATAPTGSSSAMCGLPTRS